MSGVNKLKDPPHLKVPHCVGKEGDRLELFGSLAGEPIRLLGENTQEQAAEKQAGKMSAVLKTKLNGSSKTKSPSKNGRKDHESFEVKVSAPPKGYHRWSSKYYLMKEITNLTLELLSCFGLLLMGKKAKKFGSKYTSGSSNGQEKEVDDRLPTSQEVQGTKSKRKKKLSTVAKTKNWHKEIGYDTKREKVCCLGSP